MAAVTVRPYDAADEIGWLQCRLLSFFGSAYYDDVVREKERYEHPTIELVAEADGEIVGLIDVEHGFDTGDVLQNRDGAGGMIWHLAVHPEHQRRGVATTLLGEAERLARACGLERFEAYTRDDAHVHAWYESLGFVRVSSYLHVYLDRDEGLRELDVEGSGLKLVKAFAHYTGDRPAEIRQRFRRVHDCVLFERRF